MAGRIPPPAATAPGAGRPCGTIIGNGGGAAAAAAIIAAPAAAVAGSTASSSSGYAVSVWAVSVVTTTQEYEYTQAPSVQT